MKPRNAGSAWPGPEYRIRVSFRAPIDFVFAWCTDYTPGDAVLAKDTYQREIIDRTLRAVVFEDLMVTNDAGDWSRAVVSMRPPKRLLMTGIRNNCDVVVNFAL